MPSALYTAGIAAFQIGTRAYGLVNDKAARRVRGAAAALDALPPTPPHQDCYWMHCASVGEFEQGRPVWEELMRRRPGARFVLTFFSPSGVEWFAGKRGVGEVAYLPWDSPSEASAFVERLSPKLALFVKYEWWLGIHAALREAGVPTVAFSVAFRQNQPFFRRWHPLHRGYRQALEGLTGLFVQGEDSAKLLARHGYHIEASVAGDTRLDRVLKLAAEDFTDARIERWLAGRTQVLVAGSTWPADEALLEGLLAARPDYALICAPHEVDEASRARLLERFGAFGAVTYSAADASAEGVRDARVLVLDAKGVLAKAYRYGRLAYVGGGFGAGVHNTLEPAAYALPVAIGPRYRRFDEALALVSVGVAAPCRRIGDLVSFARRYDDAGAYERTRAAARDYLSSNAGATEAVIGFLSNRGLA